MSPTLRGFSRHMIVYIKLSRFDFNMAEKFTADIKEELVDDKSENGENKKQQHKSDVEDKELEQLLDSALEDFESPQTVENISNVESSEDSCEQKINAEPSMNEIFDDVLVSQTAQKFEEMMRNLMSEDSNIMQQLQHLSAASGRDSSEATNKEFAQSLAQTLNGLSQNAENLQSPFTEDELMQAINDIGDGLSGETDLDFLPMMNGMMKSLLSKQVLYPSLKDLVDKYPEWLADNRQKVDKPLFDKYSLQYDLMKLMCEEFEQETENDSEDIKKVRFEKILEHMQKMQELGHPPSELVGQMAPGLEFDEEGQPKFPNLGEDQCGLM